MSLVTEPDLPLTPTLTEFPATEFPAIWDSTIRAAFVACPTQFLHNYCQHLKRKEFNIHLHWGGALAKGIEIARRQFYIDRVNTKQAVSAATLNLIKFWGDYESNHPKKTLESCVLALADYFDSYPMETDAVQPYRVNNKPAIECSFAVPLGVKHPDTNEPIIYSGRFDMLGEFNGAIYVVDEKSAGVLGANWRNSFRLRSQFTGYTWGAKTYGVPVAGTLIRGICPLSGRTSFEQVIENRPDWMIDRWRQQLEWDIERAIGFYRTGNWPLALDGACSAYGNGCAYLDLCTSQHPERWLSDFEVRPWQPLAARNTD